MSFEIMRKSTDSPHFALLRGKVTSKQWSHQLILNMPPASIHDSSNVKH